LSQALNLQTLYSYKIHKFSPELGIEPTPPVGENPNAIATQTDHVMSTTTDASTQYNLEDIPIENRVTSEPSRVNVDDLGKTIMTALLFFTLNWIYKTK